MTFEELSRLRCSVRSYSAQPVSEEDINYILECARLAPSAVNLQPWRFIVARSEEAVQKVRQCYHRDWINQAPLYIICVLKHDAEWVRRDGKRHGDIDIAITAEHICLAAAERGLGNCWVCNFNAALCHELFQLAETEEAAVIIPIGHPAEDFQTPEKKRMEMQEIVTIL